jgi:hypothetical protein
LGAQQRHVEADAYGLATEKIAFSNRYDCEVFAVQDDQELAAKDSADGKAIPCSPSRVAEKDSKWRGSVAATG